MSKVDKQKNAIVDGILILKEGGARRCNNTPSIVNRKFGFKKTFGIHGLFANVTVDGQSTHEERVALGKRICKGCPLNETASIGDGVYGICTAIGSVVNEKANIVVTPDTSVSVVRISDVLGKMACIKMPRRQHQLYTRDILRVRG